MTTTILAILILVGVAAALSLRVLLTDETEVRRPGCAQTARIMGEASSCPTCGASIGEACAEESTTESASSRT